MRDGFSESIARVRFVRTASTARSGLRGRCRLSQPAYRKKLIEVDLPLNDINRESSREKSIRHGHPSTLHVWWARRPLAACRAVIFASLVDDPSACPEEFPDKGVSATSSASGFTT